jgi:hypothetical protein
VFYPGNETSAELHTIHAIDPLGLYIDLVLMATALAHPVDIELTSYYALGHPNDKLHAHMSDGGGMLGAAPAFQWT